MRPKRKYRRIIYGLVDPRNDELRYIGKSQYGQYRLASHLAPSTLKKERTHKSNWIKSLLKLGLKPLFVVLKEASDNDDLCLLEIETIKFYKNLGVKLTNLTLGGEGWLGHTHTEEVRKKLSKQKTGIKMSEDAKLKMSLAHSGSNHHFFNKKLSLEHKSKISKGLKGINLGKSRDTNFKNSIAIAKGSKPFIYMKNDIVLGRFSSLREAERVTSIPRRIIKKILTGQRINFLETTFIYE